MFIIPAKKYSQSVLSIHNCKCVQNSPYMSYFGLWRMQYRHMYQKLLIFKIHSIWSFYPFNYAQHRYPVDSIFFLPVKDIVLHLLTHLSYHLQDIDCMPSNPLENMPTSMTRHISARDIENLSNFRMNGQAKDQRPEGYIKFSPSENLENVYSGPHTSAASHPTFNLLDPAKVGFFIFSKNDLFRCL